jgi:hypothetical protein
MPALEFGFDKQSVLSTFPMPLHIVVPPFPRPKHGQTCPAVLVT